MGFFIVNFKTAGIYFFDSTVTFPPKKLLDLIERIKKQGDTLLQNNKKFKIIQKKKSMILDEIMNLENFK